MARTTPAPGSKNSGHVGSARTARRRAHIRAAATRVDFPLPATDDEIIASIAAEAGAVAQAATEAGILS